MVLRRACLAACVATLALSAVAATPAVGQDSDAAELREHLARHGRMRINGSTIIEPERVSFDGGVMELVQSVGPPFRLELSDIAQLEARRGAWRRTWWIGAIAGTVLVLPGAVEVSYDDDLSEGEGGILSLLGWTAVGTVGGSVLGAVLGLPFKRWDTVYRNSGGLTAELAPVSFQRGRWAAGLTLRFAP